MRNAITYAIAMIFIFTYTSVVGKCPILDRESYAEELSRLHGALLSDYNPKLPMITMRVVSSTSTTSVNLPKFNVSLTLAYLKLTQVIEPQQRVGFVFEYFLDWRDERLSWNATEYCGIEHIYLSESDVWIPEITVVDAGKRQFGKLLNYYYVEKAGHTLRDLVARRFGNLPTVHDSFQTEDFREEIKRFVRVNSTGHASFFVPTITGIICAIDVQKFPFDKQECPIKLLSQAFSPNEYNIDIGLSPEINTGTMAFENMGNGEWELRNVSVDIIEHDSDLEQFSYKLNTFVVLMDRNPQFYNTMVILPSFVINILSIYGVFLKSADSMGKLGMALTNIMSLTFILGILATALPKTKGLPRIAIYVMVNLFIMVLALLATVILSHVHRFIGHRNSFSEKSSEKRKLKDNRLSWIIDYGMIALLELANLINFIVLVG